MRIAALTLTIIGVTDQPEAEDRMMSTKQAAELASMKPATWRGRVSRGTAPKADGHFDERTPWWWESTVRAFIAARKPPGRPRKQG